jgi:diguanylate cyclase (GGDEF)-like protein
MIQMQQQDQSAILRDALDHLNQGVVLLDPELRIEFMNHLLRNFSLFGDGQEYEGAPYEQLLRGAYARGRYDMPPEKFESYLQQRMNGLRLGDLSPSNVALADGRIMRMHLTVLSCGRRMLTYNDVTDLVQTASKLEQLATTDVLTGLNNRRRFLEVGQTEWDRFKRYNRPLALLAIDIDHFKTVNDRFGHEAGDDALVEVAQICRAGRRTTDLPARIGGEEFALLLPETGISHAEAVANRLRCQVEDKELAADGTPFFITVSIGIAEALPSMPNFGALMRRADGALYAAKHLGRNQVSLGPALIDDVRSAMAS